MAQIYITAKDGTVHKFDDTATEDFIRSKMAEFGTAPESDPAPAANPAQPEQVLPLGQRIEQGVRNIPSVLFGSKGAAAVDEMNRRRRTDSPLGDIPIGVVDSIGRMVSGAITGIPDIVGTGFNAYKHSYHPDSPVPDVPNLGANLRSAVGTPELSPDAPYWQTIGEGVGAGAAGGGFSGLLKGGTTSLMPLAGRLVGMTADTVLGHAAQEWAKNHGYGEWGQFVAGLGGGGARTVGGPIAGGIIHHTLGGGNAGTALYDKYRTLFPGQNPSAGSVGGPAINRVEAMLSKIPGLGWPVANRMDAMSANMEGALGGVADDVRGGPSQGNGQPSDIDVGRAVNTAARDTADTQRSTVNADMELLQNAVRRANPDMNGRPLVDTIDSVQRDNITSTAHREMEERAALLQAGERVDPPIPQFDPVTGAHIGDTPAPRTYNYQLPQFMRWVSEFGRDGGNLVNPSEYGRIYGAGKDAQRGPIDAVVGPGSMDATFGPYADVHGPTGVLSNLVPIGGRGRPGERDYIEPQDLAASGSMLNRGMTDPSVMAPLVNNVTPQMLAQAFGNWYDTVGRNTTGQPFSPITAGKQIGKIDPQSLETSVRTAADPAAAAGTVRDLGDIGNSMNPATKGGATRGGFAGMSGLVAGLAAGGANLFGGLPGMAAGLIPLAGALMESGPFVRSLANRYKGLGDSVRDNALGVAQTTNTVNEYQRSPANR